MKFSCFYTWDSLRGDRLAFVRAARNIRCTWRNADKCTLETRQMVSDSIDNMWLSTSRRAPALIRVIGFLTFPKLRHLAGWWPYVKQRLPKWCIGFPGNTLDCGMSCWGNMSEWTRWLESPIQQVYSNWVHACEKWNMSIDDALKVVGTLWTNVHRMVLKEHVNWIKWNWTIKLWTHER